jgi:hypothetical protein
MLRIQYEKLLVRVHRMIDEELELDTEEGRRVFVSMTQALFDEFVRSKNEREEEKRDFRTVRSIIRSNAGRAGSVEGARL